LLSKSHEIDELIARVADLLTDILQIERGTVFLSEGARRRCYVLTHAMRFLHLHGERIELREDSSLVEWIRAQDGPFRTHNLAGGVGFELLPAQEQRLLEKLDAEIIVPLRPQGTLLGFITFSGHRSGSLPNSAVVGLLGTVSEQLARAMAEASSCGETMRLDETHARTSSVAASIGGVTSGVSVAEQHRDVGPYRLQGVLGQGSFGTVWRAVHNPTGRKVALKLLHRQLAADPLVFRRFMAEIAVLSEIDHPHVVHIYDYGNSEGTPWFAMELVLGESLAGQLKRRASLDPASALELAAQVARGLSACHAAGVIHRDLSPGNILVANGRALVSDLGLALRVPADATSGQRTQTHVEGTILYMSPEQISGGRLSFASDVFSLGSVLYHCLTGGSPFRAHSLPETIDNVRMARYRPLREVRPDLGVRLDQLVD
jgi:hypothetical protein